MEAWPLWAPDTSSRGEGNELLTGPGAWLRLHCGQSEGQHVPEAPSLMANPWGILPRGLARPPGQL